jgi:transcriptional regulator with XRE-family HTH domain
MLTPKSIRERATKAHMSVEALMREAKIERSTFWRWERGIGKPHPVTVQKISDALARIEAEKAKAA